MVCVCVLWGGEERYMCRHPPPQGRQTRREGTKTHTRTHGRRLYSTSLEHHKQARAHLDVPALVGGAADEEGVGDDA